MVHSERIVRIEGNVEWRYRFIEDANRWIGVCDALDIVMEAESKEELHSVIPETLNLLFTDLIADNEFEDFLRTHGWSASSIPAPGDSEDLEILIPTHMIPEISDGSPRSAH